MNNASEEDTLEDDAPGREPLAAMAYNAGKAKPKLREAAGSDAGGSSKTEPKKVVLMVLGRTLAMLIATVAQSAAERKCGKGLVPTTASFAERISPYHDLMMLYF